MFELTDQPIDAHALRQRLASTRLGAVVTFEGVVRDHHDDREVTRLDYEAADTLAGPVFDAIRAEAIATYGDAVIHGVHRIGSLRPGDTAVWIGVATPHRAAAFDICRFVIDAIKQRLPLWKRECFTDGNDRWVNAP